MNENDIRVCRGAGWCMLPATPNSDVCRLHLLYPLKNSAEMPLKWKARVRKAMDDADKAAAKQKKSDEKLAKRGGR